MLGEFTREHETNGGLNLSAGESRLLGVGSETSSLRGNAIKDVVDERVHDGHALLGDTSVGMNLLENAVDVSRPRLSALLAALAGRRLLRCLLGGLLGWSLGHVGILVDAIACSNSFVRRAIVTMMYAEKNS